jgi:L,D-transpeptidase catalytic domain/Putative Ig domain
MRFSLKNSVLHSRMAMLPATFVAAMFALLLVVPAARSDATSVLWSSPTPADQSRFSVKTGTKVSFMLAASTPTRENVVHIAPARSLPNGAAFNTSDGSTATGTFKWTPSRAGDYTVQFTASVVGVGDVAPTITFAIHVAPRTPKIVYPRTYSLENEKVAHWAAVLRPTVVRARPTASSRKVTTLDTWTTDDTQNIVLVLNAVDVNSRLSWYRVRLPILPNNSTGWVQSRYLGPLWSVHTHLYVDRARLRATLTRDGVPVFKTIVGVGKSFWPTPRGEFYIRDKMTGFGNPVYGPVAFGTSARSAVLTDWPGGGFVGVHGTNEPSILPGHVSHGCIRMPNASIVKLARLMPVGTPLTIT